MLLAAFVGVLSFAAGCAHLTSALPGPGVSPTPSASPAASSSPTASASPTVSPSPGISPTPANCGTPASNSTAFVVISVIVTATTSPLYGVIDGYTLANSDGTFNDVAQVISLRSSDLVQFVNADNFGPASIFHSAVSFPSATKFPATPYAFPAGTSQAIGSSISSAQWSTGRLPPLAGLCYSQQFTAVPGTYYVGDFDYYNSTNMRDVIIVSSTAMKRSSASALRVRIPKL